MEGCVCVWSVSLSTLLWNRQCYAPLSRCIVHREISKSLNNCTTCQIMQLYRNGKKKKKKKRTALLCRFKFRNSRQEGDNSRAFQRQSHSRVKRERVRAVWLSYMFRVVTAGMSASTCCKPLQDYCMRSVCSIQSSMHLNMWHVLEKAQHFTVSLIALGFSCRQAAPPVLNYEKQQPGGKLDFHKTISASSVQTLILSSIGLVTQTDWKHTER